MPPEVADALEKAREAQAMIPELGQFALILALCLALVQATLPLVGAARGRRDWMALARPAAAGQFVFVAIAFGVLEYGVPDGRLQRRVRRAALELARCRLSTSSPRLGAATKARCCFGSRCSRSGRWRSPRAVARSRDEFASRVLGVLGIVSAGIIAFALFTSNPFIRLHPGAVRRQRPEPVAARPGHDHPSADAVFRLRRNGRAVRVRRRRAA